MNASPRNLIILAAAITAVVAAALTLSSGSPNIEHPATLTPEQLVDRRLRQFDELPEYDKLRVSNEIGVYYLRCDSASGYDSRTSVLIAHISSGSWFAPLPLGTGESQTKYESEDARRAIEEVIAGEELMNRIMERSPLPGRCPPELAEKAADFMKFVNDYDQLEVEDDIRVFFDECASDGEYGDNLTIIHLPTMSNVDAERVPGTLPSSQFRTGIRFVAAPSAKARLQEVLDNDELMAQIRAAGEKSVRCPDNPTWFKEPAS